jgi:PIN domain nuclease of toxin-antitoxin system
MRLLLDTHAFLWFSVADERTSETARAAIEDAANEKLVSVGSVWEMAIKCSLGRLSLAEPLPSLVEKAHDQGFQILAIELAHVARVETLPWHHRDPFDRLLIAQALVEDLAIVSADAAFDAYQRIRRIW